MSRVFKTGTVARRVGIPPPLLRMWETRYQLVTPTRGPGGQRLYSEEDVELLGAVTTLVTRGFAIGELASWPREDLLRTVRSESGIAPALPVAPESPPPTVKDVVLAVDAEGVIVVASPNLEGLLGWPHGMLVGHPIWGLLMHVPRALAPLVSGFSAPNDQTVFWAWMRTRNGEPIPCRLAVGRRRKVADGTAVSMVISPVLPGAQDLLTPLLDNVDFAGLVRFKGTPEQLFKEYVSTAVDVHGAALARVWSYDAPDGTLRLIASAGSSKAVATSQRAVIRIAGYRFKVGVVARSGIPYVHHGLDADHDFDRAWVRRERLESAAVLPLACDGVLFGVTAQFFRRRLQPDDIGRIQAAAALCERWVRGRRARARSAEQG
jgi:PAS domain-containing protein